MVHPLMIDGGLIGVYLPHRSSVAIGFGFRQQILQDLGPLGFRKVGPGLGHCGHADLLPTLFRGVGFNVSLGLAADIQTIIIVLHVYL
jgi:hypothetical protein